MKKLLAFLLLILFLILAWFSWGWYKDTVLCCNDTTETEPIETPKYGPIVYDWDSNDAITNDLWPDKKGKILAGDSEGKILSIVGNYYKNEVNNSSFENLGLARADAARKLLSSSLADDRIEISGNMIDEDKSSSDVPFNATDFNWLTRNDNVTQVGNKVLIYFPTNSNKKIENSSINNYLTELANSQKGKSNAILVSGHTDDQGNADGNRRLGLKRAKAIKAKLVELGLDASRITASSDGEDSPIATNDTEEGRQKNRRVEIEIK